jgi:N-acetylneuraminic acid mutarotase
MECWWKGSDVEERRGVGDDAFTLNSWNIPMSRIMTRWRHSYLITLLATLSPIVLLQACGGGGAGSAGNPGGPAAVSHWTWVSGSNSSGQAGVYGTLGMSAAANLPGGREGAISWIDRNNTLWLFGGIGVDGGGSGGFLNDLWKFDGANWTWVSGSTAMAQAGVYGSKGSAATTNTPGARNAAISWTDNSNNLWLFGGFGNGGGMSHGFLNDLWKFDGANWTWVSGSDTNDQSGTFGSQGTAAPTNVPGARDSAISWIDSNNNLWLFGGYGYASSGSCCRLNDLWKFDGTNWTWVSGSSTANQTGVYGTKGIAASTNVPGARDRAISWTDSHNNLWLFGGFGPDSTGTWGNLSDLWKFDGTNWTWVAGSGLADQTGVYGIQGSSSTATVPGGRFGGVSWIDNSNTLWLFGGVGYDGAGTNGTLSDLWKFDGTTWTWVSGSSTANNMGVYGTKGTNAPTNVPGARDYAIAWTDSRNTLWMFGGNGHDSAGTLGELNDLWHFVP